MGSLGEGRLCRHRIAIEPVEHHIARHIVVQFGCPRRGRGFDIHNRRQRLHIQHHSFRAVAGLGFALGNDECDRLAHVAHMTAGQREAVRDDQRAAVAALVRQTAGKGLNAGSFQIGGGEDGDDARHSLRVRDGKVADRTVGHGRANGDAPQFARQTHVIGETPGAGDQPPVFLAQHRLTDAEAVYLFRRRFLMSAGHPALPICHADRNLGPTVAKVIPAGRVVCAQMGDPGSHPTTSMTSKTDRGVVRV